MTVKGVLGPLILLLVVGCHQARVPIKLDKVVLYRNGIGYFEHRGGVEGRRLRLRFGAHELDDVLKTLTVIDRTAGAKAKATTAILPRQRAGEQKKAQQLPLDIVLGAAGAHDLLVAYSVPTPVWKATYRLVLGAANAQKALLQGWALINNASGEDWRDVRLTLATGAPMTFAMKLRAPRFLARPDISGKMVRPVTRGAVFSESAPLGRKGSGDRDRDRIPDHLDKCPDQPEVYNGYSDTDGCPDRGRVHVQSSKIEVLDKIYFERGKATIKAVSTPIVNAIAATLRGNPQIKAMEIQGHASSAEKGVWALAAQRARALRAALKRQGVRTELRARAYGATRPVDRRTTKHAHARNQRVEFRIVDRAEQQKARQQGVTLPAARASAHGGAKLKSVAGMARYVLPGRVSIPRGSATMVTLINRDIAGKDVLLYRPDSNVPGSDRHLQRATMIENNTKLTLEPGPVAIFARGTFAGEGLLSRLHPAQVALIPYALDGSTSVRRESRLDERPSSLVSVVDGVATVENISERVTRYELRVGAEGPQTLVIKHARHHGYRAVGLPPGTRELADAWLITIPVTPGKKSELSVRERRPLQRFISVGSSTRQAKRLEVYLRGSAFAGNAKLKALIAMQRQLAGALEKVDRLRVRITDIGGRNGELRESFKAVAKARGAKAAALRKRLLAQLSKSSAELERVTTDLTAASLEVGSARDKLKKQIASLRLEPATKKKR